MYATLLVLPSSARTAGSILSLSPPPFSDQHCMRRHTHTQRSRHATPRKRVPASQGGCRRRPEKRALAAMPCPACRGSDLSWAADALSPSTDRPWPLTESGRDTHTHTHTHTGRQAGRHACVLTSSRYRPGPHHAHTYPAADPMPKTLARRGGRLGLAWAAAGRACIAASRPGRAKRAQAHPQQHE